jgi:hypothetical protein
MATISKQFTFSAGATIVASQHNANFDDLYNEFNGSISNANISASAAIADTKLAQITTANKVALSALANSGTIDLSSAVFQGASPLVFEGASADDFETTLTITDPTADRTLTMPDEDIDLTNQAVKGWVHFDGDTGDTATVKDSHNVTSVARNSEGNYTITWATDFGSVNYCCVGSSNGTAVKVSTKAAGTTVILTVDFANNAADSTDINVMAIGNF